MTATKALPASVDPQKPVVTRDGLKAVLRSQWSTLKNVLPEHFKEERFYGLLLAQASKDTKLLQCTGVSILNAVFQAASLGLEINAATGEAYLIPYKDGRSGNVIATMVPGYKGLVKLAMQSPQVKGVSARLVYEGESKKFRVLYGTDDRIEHEPDFDCERTPEKVIAAYAIAKMEGSVTVFEVMTRKQLDEIRNGSLKKTNNQGPWATNPEEMYRKTPTRRLMKYLPLTSQLADAIEAADRAETGEFEPPRRSTATATLNEATAIALLDDCTKECKVVDGALVHSPECPHYAD